MQKQQLFETCQHGTPNFPMTCFRTVAENTNTLIHLHWHSKVEIMHIHTGTCQITIGNEEFTGVQNDVFIINQEELHRIVSDDSSLQYSTFIFPLETFRFAAKDAAQLQLDILLDGSFRFPAYLADNAARQQIIPVLHQMLRAEEQKPTGYELAIKVGLLQMISILICHKQLVAVDPIALEAGRSHRERLKEILSYIRMHKTQPLTITDMAEIFHMSEKYFSRYFRNVTGQTFTAYLNTIRVEYACTLLQETDQTVLEIALECGYENVSYFIRVFRSFMSCTPLQFRFSKSAQKS